jgi:hypothetical protein
MVFYRADVRGLIPGAETTRTRSPYDGHDYTYATTNLNVARAFALQADGRPHGEALSIYRVQLDPPVLWDPDFQQRPDTWFAMSHWGTVLDVVAEEPGMTLDEARTVMSTYAVWVTDKSPIYDSDGYANVPPGMAEACTAEELRSRLGKYPPPTLIMMWANFLLETQNRGLNQRWRNCTGCEI